MHNNLADCRQATSRLVKPLLTCSRAHNLSLLLLRLRYVHETSLAARRSYIHDLDKHGVCSQDVLQNSIASEQSWSKLAAADLGWSCIYNSLSRVYSVRADTTRVRSCRTLSRADAFGLARSVKETYEHGVVCLRLSVVSCTMWRDTVCFGGGQGYSLSRVLYGHQLTTLGRQPGT
jgi:hypothetical protein